MHSSLKSELIADLLQPDDDEGPSSPTTTRSATSLSNLPSELQETIFAHLFSYRELVFSGKSLVLATPPRAWPLSILRVSRNIFERANEVLRSALAGSTLIYYDCLPPFPYDGKTHMHNKLGQDDRIRVLYVHEVFLERYGPLFSEIKLPDCRFGVPNLQPFENLAKLSIGNLRMGGTCGKSEDLPMKDYVTAYCLPLIEPQNWHLITFNSHVHDIINDQNRRFKVLFPVMKLCQCHGVWKVIVDVDDKKVAEIEHVNSATNQVLNCL